MSLVDQDAVTAKIFPHPLNAWYAVAWDHEVSKKGLLARTIAKTGCGWSNVRATASSAPLDSSPAPRRATKSDGRNGESHGTVTTSAVVATARPACNPASGPAKPPIASGTTRAANGAPSAA